jgi:hypothetical protein
VEALEEASRLPAAPREQPRDDLLVEHAVQLPRHARGEEKTRRADVEREAARSPDRIVEQLRTRGQHRLLTVAGRHHAAALPEELVHPAVPLVVEDELDPGSLRCDLLGKIVDGGTEPAVDDHGVDALSCEPERLQQGLPVVADRRPPLDLKAGVPKLLADVAEIGVDGGRSGPRRRCR